MTTVLPEQINNGAVDYCTFLSIELPYLSLALELFLESLQLLCALLLVSELIGELGCLDNCASASLLGCGDLGAALEQVRLIIEIIEIIGLLSDIMV